MPTNVRDPRSIITPDAFELSEALLGTPLAGPWRRLWAILIDIVVIGVLTAVTASI
ncbi:MAG: RDD family protein, partial [Gemmatimonadetes bacterium]|nr:RDD family protein [Gemmatimonadota bacterium]